MPDEIFTEQASGNLETDTSQAKPFSEVEESDSNFVSMLEREASMLLLILTHTAAHKNNIDAEFDRTFNGEQNEQEGSIEATLQHESNWDEWHDEDAEGEDEEDWIDPDAVSNESSVTLSSKASSKRGYDEVDPSEHVYVEDPHASPGTSCAFPLYRLPTSLQVQNGCAFNDVANHPSQRFCPPRYRANLSSSSTYSSPIHIHVDIAFIKHSRIRSSTFLHH